MEQNKKIKNVKDVKEEKKKMSKKNDAWNIGNKRFRKVYKKGWKIIRRNLGKKSK